MNTLKNLFLSLVLSVLSLGAMAQDSPVSFTVVQKQQSPTEVDVIFTARIEKGWHVYSTGLPADGPISASLHTESATGAEPLGTLQHRGKELNVYDNVFGMKLRYFENSVTFIQRYKITGKTYSIKGYLEYGSCNERMCMPPTQVEFQYKGNGPADAPKAEPMPAKDTVKAVVTKPDTAAVDTVGADTSAVSVGTDLWQPVIKELNQQNGTGDTGSNSLLYIFLMGALGGFIALLTPCVWPIIPMTVSFFLKRAKDDRGRGVRDAVTYGISIVVIYLFLGIAITALFGANSLNSLATNAVFNIFFCLLLIVFAVSFFGWFEITLPSSWTNKVDSKASSTTGLLSIFLMAFTLTLVSFSCTGPIIGFLLVDFATSNSWLAPAVGMFGFALALALPFTLFALFPSWLKKSPKSGNWMNTIKVVLGFIELAFSLKFFSVADLAYGWHLMDREVFLSLWIVIFGSLGFYLMGFFRFPVDGPADGKPRSVPSIMAGMASLAFAVYMIPGLWGAPCKAVSAFAPPMYTQDFNLNTKEVKARFTDYDEGMRVAAQEGKPVLLDFTGFGCVNCRKMEAAVWTDPQVADKLTKDYVLISLFVDDRTPLPQPVEVTGNDGKKHTLRTVGDKWSYLEQTKFGYLAQPFYVAVDNQGQPLSGSFVYKEDVSAFMSFLNRGLDNYKK